MRSLILAFTLMTIPACVSSQEDPSTKSAEGQSQLILASEVNWQKLNPARGDKSPLAATLWGDRNGKEATGFLFKPVDGFQSPPHIHNVSYRGVVIRGVVHNDDPNAEKMWMPAGSFWTQPAGAVHITAAKGQNTLAYIEIEKGPYLVRPVEKSFDNGERPVNIDSSNIVWLDIENSEAAELDSGKSSKIAYLWGQVRVGQLNGTLVKLPRGFSGAIHSRSPSFRAVVIAGQLNYKAGEQPENKALTPGSSFSSMGQLKHALSVDGDSEAILYIRSQGLFKLVTHGASKG